MNRFIRTTLSALAIATAGVAASAPAANAGGIGFELSIGGPGSGVVVRDHERRGGYVDRDYDRRGGWNRFERHRDVCRLDAAVDRARDMGVRRAEVVGSNRRQVIVEGFRHHRPVQVAFANERGCPVIAFNR